MKGDKFIVFARHGETLLNVEDRFQGLMDSELTQRGIEQARILNFFLKRRFKELTFYVSPLNRARQTYQYASEGISHIMYEDSRLIEICYGAWEGKKRSEIDVKILNERMVKRYTFVHPGFFDHQPGQSYEQIYGRVKDFIQDIIKKELINDVCCITHHGVLINVARFFMDLSSQELNQLRIKNSQLILVKVNRTKSVAKFVDLS